MLLQAICGQIVSSVLNGIKPWIRFNIAAEDFDPSSVTCLMLFSFKITELCQINKQTKIKGLIQFVGQFTLFLHDTSLSDNGIIFLEDCTS